MTVPKAPHSCFQIQPMEGIQQARSRIYPSRLHSSLDFLLVKQYFKLKFNLIFNVLIFKGLEIYPKQIRFVLFELV